MPSRAEATNLVTMPLSSIVLLKASGYLRVGQLSVKSMNVKAPQPLSPMRPRKARPSSQGRKLHLVPELSLTQTPHLGRSVAGGPVAGAAQQLKCPVGAPTASGRPRPKGRHLTLPLKSKPCSPAPNLTFATLLVLVNSILGTTAALLSRRFITPSPFSISSPP